MNAKSLQVDIHSAFRRLRYPGDRRLVEHPGVRAQKVARLLRGKNPWDEPPREVLALEAEALSFLTPAAFHYFLPLFLLTEIRSPGRHPSLAWFLVCALARDDYWLAERLATLSRSQRVLLLRFCTWVGDRYPALYETASRAIEHLS